MACKRSSVRARLSPPFKPVLSFRKCGFFFSHRPKLRIDAALRINAKKVKILLAVLGRDGFLPLVTFNIFSARRWGNSNEIENKTGRVGVRGPFPFPNPT